MARVRYAMATAATLALVGGCSPEINVDPDERSGPGGPATAEFDPANSVIPFPNNLLVDPSTGLVNLPAPCTESAMARLLREGVLNKLDGFGTWKPVLTTTFSKSVAVASLEGRVKLYRRAVDGMPLSPVTANEVPIVVAPGQSERAAPDCASLTAAIEIRIIPTVPLDHNSTYVVAVLRGITTPDGEVVAPSLPWAFVRQPGNPVTVVDGEVVATTLPFDPLDANDAETLIGIDTLWKAHAGALTFLDGVLDLPRSDVLVAWDFNTQTVPDPLDANVAGSPAAQLPAAPLSGVVSIAGGDVLAHMNAVFGAIGQIGLCDEVLPCFAVGDILRGTLDAPSYQVGLPNPLPGGEAIPGPWTDPLTPTQIGAETIGVLLFVPATPAPAAGYPVISFAHGLGSSMTSVYLIAGQLTAAGFVVAAINSVAHGDRAVRISDTAATGCDDSPSVGDAPQCFASILTTDLAATRDSFRQSALDQLALIKSLGACTGGACGEIPIDATRMGYMGMSLGAVIGSLVVAMGDDLRAGVLASGGAGLIDLTENTGSNAIRCPLVDSLIDAGILVGEPSSAGPDALCLDPSWKTQPGYLVFSSIARWIVDPADGINYGAQLSQKHLLIQEVVGDAVIPNMMTAQQAAVAGLSVQLADMSLDASPSAAIVASPTASKWIAYETLESDPGSGFPGNNFAHASLVVPATSNNAGTLGTIKMQADAITYLIQNMGPQ